MNNLGLQSPWVTIYNMICEMFNDDAELTISELDNFDMPYHFTIMTKNHEKYRILNKYLIKDYTFGKVHLNCEIIYDGENDCVVNDIVDDFGHLFIGNHHVSQVKGITTDYGKFVYVIFKKEVIQFYNDDISDLYGNWNGLMEDIARKIFHDAGVNFCTAVK